MPRLIDKTGVATFEPFVERHGGEVWFANRFPVAGSFRQRCWPVFQPVRRRRRAKRKQSLHAVLVNKAIEREARLVEARKWMPLHPLLVHAMAVEDAIRERKHGRAT